MTMVAIVGAGDIGGATAQAIASCDRVSRVLLVDTAGAAPEEELTCPHSTSIATRSRCTKR